jgi:hypothetical protein
LISLKKIVASLLAVNPFADTVQKCAIKWGKVFPLVDCRPQKGINGVSRGVIAESGCKGAAVSADPAP